MEELLRQLYGKYAADLSPEEVNKKIKFALTVEPNKAVDLFYKKYTGGGPTEQQRSAVVQFLQKRTSKEAPQDPSMWKSLTNGFKTIYKSMAAEGPMMNAADRLTETNKQINLIHNSPDDQTFFVGGYAVPRGPYYKGEEVDKEGALDYYKKKKAEDEMIWLENFSQAEEIQSEIDKYTKARIFDEQGNFDLQGREVPQIVMEQLPQMLGSFVGGTYFQEAGGVMERLMNKQAAEDLNISEQDFMQLSQQERGTAFLDIINDGRAEDILDDAHRTGLINQGFDVLSAGFMATRAVKFIPKDAMRRALKGNFKELSKALKYQGTSTGVEILTENAQEINSALTTGDPITAMLLAETTAQTIIGAGGTQLSIGGASFTYNEGMAQYSAITDPTSVAAIAKQMRTQIKNDRRRTEDNKLDLLRQIDIVESLTKNSKFNNLDPEARQEFFKNEYARQKQFDKIEVLEKRLEKRPNNLELEYQINEAKLALGDIEDNMSSVLYFNNYKANGMKFAEFINSKKKGFFADKNVIIRENKKELENYLKKYDLDALNDPSIQNVLNGKSNGALNKNGKTAYIINENIRNNSIKKGGAIGRDAGNVVHHEVIHMLFHSMPDNIRAKIKNEIDLALKENKDSDIQKIYEALQKRLKAYEGKGDSVLSHEFFAGLSDVLSPIQAAKNIEQVGLFRKIGQIFNSNLNVLNLPTIIDSQNALEIMQKYNSFNGIETTIRQDVEKAAGDIASTVAGRGVDVDDQVSLESVNPTDMATSLDQYITEDINSKEAFQASDVAKAGVYTEIEINNVLDGYISNMIVEDQNLGGLPSDIQEDVKRKVKERITDRILKNFDPNKEGSKRSLFSYIYGDAKGKGRNGIAYKSLLDIKQQYAKDTKTTSITTDEGSTIDIADDTTISIEDQIDNKILSENIDNTTNPKIEDEIDVFSKQDIKDIEDFVSQIFGDEVILDPKDSNFRNKIKEIYEKAVMPKVRSLAGNFENFFDNYINKLFDPKKKLLPIQYLYQAERTLKDKNFAKFNKRLTTQEQIRKARDAKNAFVENEAQGVDLYDRLKPSLETLKEYFSYGEKKPNTTARARRNKLFAAIGTEVLFNKTPNQLKQANLTDEEKAVAARKIERSLESLELAEKVGLENIYYKLEPGNMDVARRFAKQWVKILPYFDKYPGLLNLGTFTNGLLKDGDIDSQQKAEIEKILLAGSNKWVGNKTKTYGKPAKKGEENYYKGGPFTKTILNNESVEKLEARSDRYANAGIHFWTAVNQAVNDPDNGDLNFIAISHYLDNARSEKSHVHRRAARLFGYDVVTLANNEQMIFEHAMQSTRAKNELMKGAKKPTEPFHDFLEKVFDNYYVIGLSKQDADNVDSATFVDFRGEVRRYKFLMGPNWFVDTGKWIQRYANSDVAANGGVNLKRLKTLKGVTFEKEFNIKNDGTTLDVALESKDQNLSQDLNDIIEQKKGAKFASEKRYSDKKARRRARKAGPKGIMKFVIPPGAEDFQGLMYTLLPKGELGNTAMEWFRQNLFRPYGLAMENINRERMALMNDFRELKNKLNKVPKKLKEEVLDGDYTKEDAIRVWIWNKQGNAIPGLTETDQKKLVAIVEKDKGLKTFANELININKGDGYAKPENSWDYGTITTDLYENINTTKRAKHLEKWKQNVDEIFSNENLNKLEAAFGSDYRAALENILRRMESGRNRPGGGDKQINAWLEWINNSVGVIMFLNVRSAMLQMISTINYMNWSDNNPLQAAKAYANPKQFWSDFLFIYNSDYLKERRGGLQLNVNESEIAEMANKNGVKGVINLLLNKGFVLTRAADSFAIANGGAAFFRNRTNTYIKQGMSQQEAETKAFQDFRELTEEAQQSSRPDRISKQQASELGRIVLAFANTPMQYTRLMKRAAQDIANGRGDWKTNWSKLIYYSTIQNFIFNAMQQALFAIGFGEDEVEEVDKKVTGVANGMVDSVLRGTGIYGNVAMMGKNVAREIVKQANKPRPDYDKAIDRAFSISPPISSKLSRLRQASYTFENEMDEIKNEGLSVDNPGIMATAQIISATTNVPLDRVVRLFDNYRAAVAEDTEAWQRVALILGWGTWELGVEDDSEGLKIENRKLNHKKFKKKTLKKRTLK
jgi:AraC-like DNA-binding protein